MAKTRVSYAEAVQLLTGGPDTVTVLSRLAGGALLAAAPFAPGVLGLFDAKGEANTLLRDMVGAAPARIRASRGKRHYELLQAAHGLLVVSSFFDAAADAYGPKYAALELTDDEKRRIGEQGGHPLRDELAQPSAPMPGVLRGFTENRAYVAHALKRIAQACNTFIAGLAAGRDLPAIGNAVVDDAVARYQESYVRLSADVPEFAIWSQLDEHAATRAEIRRQTDTLTRLSELLTGMVDPRAPAAEAEQRLARHAAAVLHRPLWRAGTADGLTFPLVEDGFVSPRFRMAVVDKDSRLADETWWGEQAARDDLAGFLAAWFADPASTQQPLVVLGHPGAGKSLLTEVLAARLPAAQFTTVRVPLRNVDPDAHIHQQVEATVERLVKERLSWGELSRASDTTKVVLLDGYDELIQATGVMQSNYLNQAASFQQDEWINDRPVAVVVTSRTLVMDRTPVPAGTLVVKLEPFDEQQAGQWLTAWNAANAGARPLTVDEMWAHPDLAGQPLLLLMLAIYAAGTAGAGGDDLSTEDLYRRLLDEFIRRQVRDKARADLSPAASAAHEAAARRDLAAVAFAMFNRGRQFVSEDDLDRDLEALHPAAPVQALPGEPLTRARRTIAGFFFVHVAQTDDDTRAPGRRTYEFLHATFAEYLVAEQTTELLRDLADDWRRSRSRTYGASLDQRILRALLSHQPLTNGDQTFAFLTTMIENLPREVRDDLRDALLELFRGARAGVPDDPYRPTPMDVVARVAAWTANLALLAALCDPGGLPVTALAAPGVESAVRLWRSGLDPEAQVAFFGRLTRTEDRFTVSMSGPASLLAAEAQLIGDHYAETVVLAGERPLRGVGQVTTFQRDIHLHVLQMIVSRWPGAPGRRMMPFDEKMYLELAELAERPSEQQLTVTAHLIVRLLVEDHQHLPGDLLDRLLVAAIRPHAEAMQPRLAILALRQPELLSRHQWLIPRPVFNRPAAAFVHEVAVALRDDTTKGTLDLLIEELEAHLRGPDADDLSDLTVTPSMVGSLTVAPTLLPSVIRSLAGFEDLAWSQVPPDDMLNAVEAMGSRAGLVRLEITDYLAHHARTADDDTRSVLDRIRDRLT